MTTIITPPMMNQTNLPPPIPSGHHLAPLPTQHSFTYKLPPAQGAWRDRGRGRVLGFRRRVLLLQS